MTWPLQCTSLHNMSLGDAFFLGLDRRLYMSCKSPATVVFVSVFFLGQVAISSWKVLHSKRLPYFEQVLLCQFLLWYRNTKQGHKNINDWSQGAPKTP